MEGNLQVEWLGKWHNNLVVRRYHTYQRGRYPLPNDDGENDRETLKHIMLKEVVDGQLHLAPIGDNPRKIVDLGTGFGEWAVEGLDTISRQNHVSRVHPQT